MKEILINPENFTADKILNMLDEKKLENLQNEFEKIVKEDVIILKMKAKFQKILMKKEKEAKMEQYLIREAKVGLNPNQIHNQLALAKKQSTQEHKHKSQLVSKHEFQHKSAQEEAAMSDNEEMTESKMQIQNHDDDDDEVDGLTVSQFVRVMLRILSKRRDAKSSTDSKARSTKNLSKAAQSFRFQPVEHETAEFYDLVFGLCQLFEEIDINGDGTMEWTELMQFLMDTVNQRDQMTLDMNQASEQMAEENENQDDENYKSGLSNITGKSDFSFVSDFSEVNEAKKNLQDQIVENVLQTFLLSKYHKFHESETIVDRIIHKSTLISAIYNMKFGRFIMVEKDQAQTIVVAKLLSN